MRLQQWIIAVSGLLLSAVAPLAHTQDATSLRARYLDLRKELLDNQFQHPIHLTSRESTHTLQGEVYAVVAQPFATIGSALQDSKSWCDIVILHLNVKGCSVVASPAGDIVTMSVGRKSDQPLANAYRLDFQFKTTAATKDYAQITLHAATGPLGTSDYRIVLEVAPLDANHSFLHFSYSYDYGLTSRIALNSYLATAGRNKVGFTVVGRKPDGQPEYTRKMRGVVERNAMRYYLAVDAYLGALFLPESEQVERRLEMWHASVEKYPVQLHELEHDEYVTMKRKEIRRQEDSEETARR